MILSIEFAALLAWIGLLSLAFVFNKAAVKAWSFLEKAPPTQPTGQELELARDLDVSRSQLSLTQERHNYEKQMLEDRIRGLEAELIEAKASRNEILKQVISRMSE